MIKFKFWSFLIILENLDREEWCCVDAVQDFHVRRILTDMFSTFLRDGINFRFFPNSDTGYVHRIPSGNSNIWFIGLELPQDTIKVVRILLFIYMLLFIDKIK